MEESQKKIENLNKATLYTTSFYITSILFAFLIKNIMKNHQLNFNYSLYSKIKNVTLTKH